MTKIGISNLYVQQEKPPVNQVQNTKSEVKPPINKIEIKDTTKINNIKASNLPSSPVKLVVDEDRDEFSKAKDEAGNKVVEETAGKITAKIVAKVSVIKGLEIAELESPRLIQKSVAALGKIEKNAVGRFVIGGLKATTNSVDNVIDKVFDKVAGKAIDKLALKVSTKMGVKTATNLGKAVPFLGAALGVYCTKEDIDNLKSKMNDKSVSRTSKVLAGATVALDVVSVGSSLVTATAGSKGGLHVALVAEGVNLAATGVSILTSGLSEYYKKK